MVKLQPPEAETIPVGIIHPPVSPEVTCPSLSSQSPFSACLSISVHRENHPKSHIDVCLFRGLAVK